MLLAKDDLLDFKITSMYVFFFLSTIVYLSGLLHFDIIEIMMSIIFIILLFSVVFCVFLFPYFKKNRILAIGPSIILVIILIAFGGLTTSQWGFLSAALAVGSMLFTEDFFTKFFGVKLSLRASSILVRGRVIIVLMAPILFISVNLITSQCVEEKILHNKLEYIKYDPKEVKLFENGKEIKAIGDSSLRNTKYILDFIDGEHVRHGIISLEFDKIINKLYSFKDLTVKYRGIDFKIENVTFDEQMGVYYLFVHKRNLNNNETIAKLLTSLLRFIFIELIGMVCINVYFRCFYRNPKENWLLKFISREKSGIDIQGHWFLLNKYEFDNREFLFSVSSFYILGNLLYIGKEVYQLIKKNDKISIKSQPGVSFEILDDYTIKYDEYTFIHSYSKKKKDLFVKYKVPKNRFGNKVYFKESNEKILLGEDLADKENVLCLDMQNNKLIETRLKFQKKCYFVAEEITNLESSEQSILYSSEDIPIVYINKPDKREIIVGGVRYIEIKNQ